MNLKGEVAGRLPGGSAGGAHAVAISGSGDVYLVSTQRKGAEIHTAISSNSAGAASGQVWRFAIRDMRAPAAFRLSAAKRAGAACLVYRYTSSACPACLARLGGD